MQQDGERPQPTPERIVETDGTVHEGWFERPFAVANLHEAPAAHLLSGLRGTAFGPLERAYRRMRLKEWQYVSVAGERAFFACAVVDAGYIGTAFAYVVDHERGRCCEYGTLAPLARGVAVAPSSLEGTSRIEARGFGRIAIENAVSRGERIVSVELDAHRRAPALSARLVVRDDGRTAPPVAVVEPTAPGRWLYTHKCYGLPTNGTIVCGELDGAIGEGWAGIDYNRGFRPNETHWNWAAAAGRAEGGAIVGFNLTAHRPWKGAAAAAADHGDEDARDCALWLDGELTKIPRVEFDYDTHDLMKPWRIRDREGLCDLEFRGDGSRSDDVDLRLVVSRFHQPYGRFRGTLRTRGGRSFSVSDLYGVTEEHYARW